MNIWEHALRYLNEATKDYYPLEWDDPAELVASKRTSKSQTYTLSDPEFKKLLSAAQKGRGTLKVNSIIDSKPIAVLDSKDLVASLLGKGVKMPTMEVRGDGQFWICNIPPSAYAKARGAKTPVQKQAPGGI